MDEEYSVSDFSFNDLLEEIESDISFFDSDNLVEEKVAYETKSHAENEMQGPESDDTKNTIEKESKISDIDNPFEIKHDQMQEKHLILVGINIF